jgi:TatD DNase family protein
VWFDTHIHLDAAEYAGNQAALLQDARQVGVHGWVIPAVTPANFDAVRILAHHVQGASYALGIHPMFVNTCTCEALDQLQAALQTHKNDPKLVAVGEIGLDYFMPTISVEQVARQMQFFKAQLKLAQQYDLPVLLHVRKAQDSVAKALRQHPICGGIVHAFNGSSQQAQAFIDLGLCLGFGGAATYSRALQIRQHLANVPEQAVVLETDAPDMAPEWLAKQLNSPVSLAKIGGVLAAIRGVPVDEFSRMCLDNSRRILPKIGLVAILS